MIRIIVAGTMGSGKTSVALTVQKALENLGCKVQIIESDDPSTGLTQKMAESTASETAKHILEVKKPEVLISTQQILRGASPEQIEKAWMSLPAVRNPH